MVGSGVPAAAIFCENLADADDAALMRLVISLKNGSLPIRRAIIGLNSAARKLFCIFENNISAQNVSITYNITNTIDYHEFL